MLLKQQQQKPTPLPPFDSDDMNSAESARSGSPEDTLRYLRETQARMMRASEQDRAGPLGIGFEIFAAAQLTLVAQARLRFRRRASRNTLALRLAHRGRLEKVVALRSGLQLDAFALEARQHSTTDPSTLAHHLPLRRDLHRLTQHLRVGAPSSQAGAFSCLRAFPTPSQRHFWEGFPSPDKP